MAEEASPARVQTGRRAEPQTHLIGASFVGGNVGGLTNEPLEDEHLSTAVVPSVVPCLGSKLMIPLGNVAEQFRGSSFQVRKLQTWQCLGSLALALLQLSVNGIRS